MQNHHPPAAKTQLVLAHKLGCSAGGARYLLGRARRWILLLFRDSGNMATFAADFFPPDFSQWQTTSVKWRSPGKLPSGVTALAVIPPFRLA